MSNWFDLVLCPESLGRELAGGEPGPDTASLLHNLLNNLLSSQNNGFFTETPFELYFSESVERKVPVVHNLCLQLVSSLDWRLGEVEKILPPPLLLYLLQSYLQAQPEQASLGLAKTAGHSGLNLDHLAKPGPTLHALVLFHRWVLRTYMDCRTPQRIERTSNVMVPGVRREPAVIYRDQTNNVAVAVAPTSTKLLQAVLDAELAPSSVPAYPSFASFKDYTVKNWSSVTECNKSLFLCLIAYDLGCSYFYNEEYSKSKDCFTKYFQHSARLENVNLSDINVERMNGCLLCLDMVPPTVGVAADKGGELRTRFLNTPRSKQRELVQILEEDNKWQVISTTDRDSLELDTAADKGTSSKEMLADIAAQNVIRRALRGMPLTNRALKHLAPITPAVRERFERQVVSLLAGASPLERRLLTSLTYQLILHGILPPSSRLAKASEIDQTWLASYSSSPPSPSKMLQPSVLTLADTFNLEKVCKYNAAVQLLATFNCKHISALARGFRGISKTSQRWHLEDHLLKSLNKATNFGDYDTVYIYLAKVNQLKRMNRLSEAKSLILEVGTEIGGQQRAGDRSLGFLVRSLKAEELCIDLLLKEVEQGEEAGGGVAAPVKADAIPDVKMRALTTLETPDQSPTVAQELSLQWLLGAANWEEVSNRLARQPPQHNQRKGIGVVGNLARSLANLMANLSSNNPQLVKKLGREVWDVITPLVSNGANKRGGVKDGGSPLLSPVKERAEVLLFLERLYNQELCVLVLSLLATLFNVARDDAGTELLSLYTSVWPTGLATNQSIQDRMVEDMLSTVLAACLKRFTRDANILQTSADLQFANGHYSSALSLYVETVATRTEFFQKNIDQTVLDETCVNRMIKCCTELGRLTQAVILTQFIQDPNYAQAFKYLEDRETSDGGDSFYTCIWDMAILEFAMSLHTRRGEMARRREALACIMQLELNTNNETEIQREAANIRKAIFFRSLAAQFF